MNCIVNSLCPWREQTEDAADSWADEKTKAVESILEERNPGLQALQDQLKGIIYLPNRKNRAVRLIYLTLIRKDKGFCPFTGFQESIFRASANTDTAAQRCLSAGCCITVTAGAVSLGAVGPGCFAHSWILQSIGIISNAIGSTVSYLSTGCYPHLASVKANEKQNVYHEAERIYTELGSYLIELAEQDPVFAQDIAANLRIDDICNVMEKTLSKEDSAALVKPLKKAKKFVLTGKVPSSPLDLKNCVDNVLLRRQIGQMRLQLQGSQPLISTGTEPASDKGKGVHIE